MPSSYRGRREHHVHEDQVRVLGRVGAGGELGGGARRVEGVGGSGRVNPLPTGRLQDESSFFDLDLVLSAHSCSISLKARTNH